MVLKKELKDILKDIKRKKLDFIVEVGANEVVITYGAFSELYIRADLNGNVTKFEYDLETADKIKKFNIEFAINNWIEL